MWLVRLEAAATPDEVLDALVAAMDASGGEAVLWSGCGRGRRS